MDFSRFIDATAWMPRQQCGFFPVWLIAWLVIVNTWIFVSYVRIPVSIARIRLENDLPGYLRGPLLWLVFFVLSCAVGHLIQDVMPFWYPNYILAAFWGTITAVISHFASANMISVVDGLNRDAVAMKKQAAKLADQIEEAAEIAAAEADESLPNQNGDKSVDSAIDRLRQIAGEIRDFGGTDGQS